MTARLPRLAALALLAAGAVALTASRRAAAHAAPAAPAPNPFFAPSPLPFQAPPFDRIHDADYQPALDSGMAAELAEINAIAGQSAPPTFANTIEAMERSGQLLMRVSLVFNGITGANIDDTLQKVQTAEAPRLAAHRDDIYLNARLFARIHAIWLRRDSLGLDPAQRHLVEKYHTDFLRAGVALADSDQAKLKALNQEQAALETEFSRKLRLATKAAALVVAERKQLAGLTEGEVAAAAAAAKERGQQGLWLLRLINTTQQPPLASLQDRTVREELFASSVTRAEQNDSNDTRATIQRLVQVRARKAKLLGYPSWAAYSVADQMAKTPDAAIKLMTDLAGPATRKALAEQADMQALIDAGKDPHPLRPWDWQIYAEQVRKQRFDLDESQLTPYFELDRVLRDGVFYAANRMYGLTFKERKDLPVYQPDVRVFEVFDADGTSLALWYCDYFKRDNKGPGAWMDNFVIQSTLLGTKPVVFNVANFPKPAPGQPALLTSTDVTTMFHEFGHALHGMMSNVVYPTQQGTNVPRDFVEFPSQFNEHWATEPTVFAHYAKHYKTGAPMPAELAAKMKKAATFNMGFKTTEYLAAALLDMAWHTLGPDAPPQDVDVFEAQALKDFHVDLANVPPRYRTSYFSHLWSSPGYAAGYYAYLWSEVIDDDVYAWFTANGGMTRANGQRLRDMILSRGGTEDAGAMFKAFTGRDPYVEPLLEQRGLTAN
ncbi:MAG TPA: M3 family metallopeptidase [Gemmatimonadaceae bacterium]|nr:M3 family metallopeptidase [Gemmatimonadaceae bacterium]